MHTANPCPRFLRRRIPAGRAAVRPTGTAPGRAAIFLPLLAVFSSVVPTILDCLTSVTDFTTKRLPVGCPRAYPPELTRPKKGAGGLAVCRQKPTAVIKN